MNFALSYFILNELFVQIQYRVNIEVKTLVTNVDHFQRPLKKVLFKITLYKSLFSLDGKQI